MKSAGKGIEGSVKKIMEEKEGRRAMRDEASVTVHDQRKAKVTTDSKRK